LSAAAAAPDLSRRGAALLLGGLALALVAGCAGPAALNKVGAGSADAWSGRLSLRVDSEPAQTFSASFDLRGNPQAGELTLTSPIGSTLAQLHWAPGEALLMNGGQTRHFDSVDALSEAATGAAIPLGALFAWLAGRNETAPGWRPDLSQVSAGRLQATRESPQPRADLRIVFERA
jgi:outer membrane lipoprotein LolB